MSTTSETAIPLAKATCPLCKVTFLFEYGVRRHDVRSHLGNMHPNIRYERNFEAAMEKMLATAEPAAPAAGELPAVVVTADDLAEMLEAAQSIERGLRADLDGMVRIEAELRDRVGVISVALGRIAGQPCIVARGGGAACQTGTELACDTCNARRALKGGA